MNLLPIDPGVKACALACFVNCTLIAVTNTLTWRWGALHSHTEIVCEAMRVYPHEIKNSKPAELIAKANDLIHVEAAGMRLVGQIEASCLSTHAVYRPTAPEWKGQVPKPIHHGQILRALSPAELGILLVIKPDLVSYVAKACARYSRSKALTGYSNPIHNTLDSVGIGLKHLKRIR